MHRPFLFISAPLVVGIIASYIFTFNIFVLMSALVLLLLIYFTSIIMGKSNEIVLFLLFLFLGIVLGTVQLHDSILKNKVGKNLIFEGIVHDISYKDESQGKYVVVVKKFKDGEKIVSLKEKIMLRVIGNKDLKLGDEVVFQGTLREPTRNTNPMLYNYRLNLLSNRIYTTISIKEYDILEVDRGNKSLKYILKDSFKEKVNSVFDKYLDKTNSSLIKGMILGEYSYLDDDDITKYRELGLAHILAVSGLHIAIIAGFIVLMLSYLGVKRKISILITIIAIWFYGFLLGFPPSILRANIMFSLSSLAFLLKEPYDPLNNLCFSLFVMLIVNPYWIFNLGFQLSFIATYSLIYFTPKIKEFFYLYNNKISYALWGILAVYIGLLPVQAYYFNRISVIGIVSNLILAPVFSIALVLGVIMILFSYIFPFLNLIAGEVLDLILSLQHIAVNFFHNIPFGIIKLHSPSIYEFILYYIFLLLIFKVVDLKQVDLKVAKTIICFLALSVAFNSIMLMIDDSMAIHFIDVGQGDAILMRTKRDNYLIDTGGSIFDSFDVGENITLPYLEKLGINKLKAVFISHFDEDHSEALPLLVDNLNIENILISYKDEGNSIYDYIKSKNIPVIVLNEGARINLDDGIFMEVISPNEDMLKRWTKGNNLSLVLLLNYYGKKVLFPGDIEKEVEWEILRKFNGPIDIIKVPHHGSNTSSTEELLNLLNPKIAVISVGRNNIYGHPKDEVIDRYKRIGAEIYRTDLHGLIEVKLNRDKIIIDNFLKEKESFLDFLLNNSYFVGYYLLYCLMSYILIKRYLYLKGRLKTDELQGTYQ